MDTVKVVIMAGPWTEWREELESVSPRVEAVAAHSDEDLLREIRGRGRRLRAVAADPVSEGEEDSAGCRASASASKPCCIGK